MAVFMLGPFETNDVMKKYANKRNIIYLSDT